VSSEEARARPRSPLQERLERLGARVAAEEAARAARGRASQPSREPTSQADAPEDPGEQSRFDHGLAEFPAFRFGKRRMQSEEILRFADAISGPNGERLERAWTVFPSAKWGYGGATTQALLFDLHQVWREQGFRGSRIYFGTLRKLYQRQHAGKNPAPLDYARLRRDLDILCGYEFDCENAFWDPVSRTYGNMRAWHLFTGWYEARRARSGDLQDELPFGFIEVSDTFAKVAQERGFFVTGFDSPFFHSLRPVEQRLALYLSKMFASQQVHRRYEEDIYGALPIEGTALNKRRQTLREAAEGLRKKGYPNLARFALERSPKTGRWVATFHRARKVEQEAPVRPPSVDSVPEHLRPLVEDVVELTQDPGSIPMWVRSIRGLGEEAVRFALGDLRAEQAQRRAAGRDLIKNPGAWLTTKLMAMARDRGVVITRHPGQTRRP
jgi:hypothetical protein